MSREQELGRDPETGHGSLLALALLAPLVGAASGLVGALFRLCLAQADRWRDALIAWAHGWEFLGFLLVCAGCATAVAAAAWLVRRVSPHASGSGIPHVEAVLREELPQAPYRLIPVKFVGGLLAIGSGLALGREGPSVQMGASIAHLVGPDVSTRLARLPGAAGGGGGRRPCHRLQRADRRRGVRARGAGAALRAAHGDRGARRVGDRDRGGARFCSATHPISRSWRWSIPAAPPRRSTSCSARSPACWPSSTTARC